MSQAQITGGAFLITPVGKTAIFTPEQFSEEQIKFYQTARDFVLKEVVPVADRCEKKEPGLMPRLLKKAGEIGLLMVDVPEKYDGLGLDKTSSICILRTYLTR